MPTETSPNRPNGPQEPDWTEALYRSSADEQPPPALDAAIKAAAREHEQPWYANPGRLTALATAATVLVAAMIAYHLPETSDSTPAAEPASPPAETAATVQPTPFAEDQAPGRAALRQTGAPSAATPDRPGPVRTSVEDSTLTEATPGDALDALIEACGEPPGTEAERELRSDERGWYLVVTTDSATLYLRCVAGAWQPTPEPDSEEQ